MVRPWLEPHIPPESVRHGDESGYLGWQEHNKLLGPRNSYGRAVSLLSSSFLWLGTTWSVYSTKQRITWKGCTFLTAGGHACHLSFLRMTLHLSELVGSVSARSQPAMVPRRDRLHLRIFGLGLFQGALSPTTVRTWQLSAPPFCSYRQ